MSQADNSVKIWWNLPISNPKPDLYSINAHTKSGENPLMFKLSSGNKIRMYDGQTDGHTDVQRETITPRHDHVAGYKKPNFRPVSLRFRLIFFWASQTVCLLVTKPKLQPNFVF